MQKNNFGARLGARTPGAAATTHRGIANVGQDDAVITRNAVDAQAALENARVRFLKTRHFLRTAVAKVYDAELALLVGGGR